MKARDVWTALVPQQRPTPLRAVLVATLALVGAVLFRLPFESFLAGTLPYATFFPAILLATLLGGSLAGSLALIVGGPLALGMFGSEALGTPVASLLIWLMNGLLIYVMALGLTQLVSAYRLHEAEIAGAQARLRTVVAELQHRARNSYAVIGALVRQSATGADSVQAYRDRLSQRLEVLARANELGSGEDWRDLDLMSLVSAVLHPFHGAGAGQLLIRGPDCRVGSQTGTALTLTLHELATNALKYGALSNSSGRVECVWSLDPGRVVLTWREVGGPAVHAPARAGFGSQLIRSAFAGDAPDGADLRFEPTGVECELRFARFEAPADAVISRTDPRSGGIVKNDAEGATVA
jgi:two-component sensor histidine kinase